MNILTWKQIQMRVKKMKNTKPFVSRNENEDLIESNKLLSEENERFCDKDAEDNQEISNEVQQEMDLIQNPGQLMEVLDHKILDS